MQERKSIITRIFEHQRNIIMLKQFIKEYEKDGADTRKMKKEISELERKIEELQMKFEMIY